MKRIFGGLLMLAGAFALYVFTARAMTFGREQISAAFDLRLPLLLAGVDYPTGALILAGALWGFILGLWFIVTGGDDASQALRGGRISRLMLLNALLLLSTLGVAYLGARNNGGPTLVAVFGLVALAQAAFGLLLLILSLFERPKGIASLAFGALVYLGGVGIGVMTFLWGGGP
jgi:hypothetical protein